jgi:hypothetical protein
MAQWRKHITGFQFQSISGHRRRLWWLQRLTSPTHRRRRPIHRGRLDGTVFTYLLGPRLSYRKYDRITPFAQVLFGGIHASDVELSSGCVGAGCTVLPSENSFALTAGGGLDFRLHHHIALRLIQAEYLMTRFDDLATGSTGTQNDMRLSTGLVFRFGGGARAPEREPITYSCSVNPTAVYPGEPIAVSGTAMNLNPSRTAVYTWSVDGGTVSGSTSTASIDTTNLAPGTYTSKAISPRATSLVTMRIAPRPIRSRRLNRQP